jgi:hypothetical protein
MAALEVSTALSGRGHTYTHLQVADSARAHFGDNYTIYYTSNVGRLQSRMLTRRLLSQGSIPVEPSDRDALAGPLNVSSATQALILITTNIDKKLSSGSLPHFRDGMLQSEIGTFRTTLHTLPPTSILASLSPNRAALLPATDLVAVLSESVLLFSKIEDSISSISEKSDVRPIGSEAADVATEITNHSGEWMLKLEEINSVLTDYISVLNWFANL